MDAKAFDLPRYLSVLPLFQQMNSVELQRLADGCSLQRLSRGDTVFSVGQPCEGFHVTVVGQVKLFAISPAGQEKVIELIGPGNSFAEKAASMIAYGATRFGQNTTGLERRSQPVYRVNLGETKFLGEAPKPAAP